MTHICVWVCSLAWNAAEGIRQQRCKPTHKRTFAKICIYHITLHFLSSIWRQMRAAASNPCQEITTAKRRAWDWFDTIDCSCTSWACWAYPSRLTHENEWIDDCESRFLTSACVAGQPVQLLKGLDSNKDQSYFLASVPAHALQHFMFPLGGMLKPDVRVLAAKAGLSAAARRSSAGLCFIGKMIALVRWQSNLCHHAVLSLEQRGAGRARHQSRPEPHTISPSTLICIKADYSSSSYTKTGDFLFGMMLNVASNSLPDSFWHWQVKIPSDANYASHWDKKKELQLSACVSRAQDHWKLCCWITELVDWPFAAANVWVEYLVYELITQGENRKDIKLTTNWVSVHSLDPYLLIGCPTNIHRFKQR